MKIIHFLDYMNSKRSTKVKRTMSKSGDNESVIMPIEVVNAIRQVITNNSIIGN